MPRRKSSPDSPPIPAPKAPRVALSDEERRKLIDQFLATRAEREAARVAEQRAMIDKAPRRGRKAKAVAG